MAPPPAWYGAVSGFSKPSAISGWCPELDVDFTFRGVTVQTLVVEARADNLKKVVGSCLGSGFRPAPVTGAVEGRTIVSIDLINYAEMKPGAGPTLGQASFSQKELVFRVDVEQLSSGRPIGPPRIFVPFIFVDEPVSAVVGRAVCGYPKLMATFADPVDGVVEVSGAKSGATPRSRIRFPVTTAAEETSCKNTGAGYFVQRTHPVLVTGLWAQGTCASSVPADGARTFFHEDVPNCKFVQHPSDFVTSAVIELFAGACEIAKTLGCVNRPAAPPGTFQLQAVAGTAVEIAETRWIEEA
jgi:hypothetical protein